VNSYCGMSAVRITPSCTVCESLEVAECATSFQIQLVSKLLKQCVLRACPVIGTPCWEYTGATCNKRYAHFSWWDPLLKRQFWKRGHIWLWELVTGRKVQDGYTLDHQCLNTKCVRPEHLEEVTRARNTARGNRTRHGYAAEA